MPLQNDISHQSLVIWGITITVIFVIMVIGIYRNIKVLRDRRKEMNVRIHGLLLSNMLDRLGITLKNYFHKTSDLDKERHIWKCERCAKPDTCEHMLLGENIDPNTFCPNYPELEKIKEKLEGSANI